MVNLIVLFMKSACFETSEEFYTWNKNIFVPKCVKIGQNFVKMDRTI